LPDRQLSDLDQFIRSGSQTDLFGVAEATAPFRFWRGIDEMVVMVDEMRLVEIVRQLAIRQRGCSQAGIGTGLVEGQWVERGKHADVGQDGGVVLAVAVTVGRNINHQGDVELRPARHNGLGIFGHAVIENLDCIAIDELDCIEIA